MKQDAQGEPMVRIVYGGGGYLLLFTDALGQYFPRILGI